MGFDFQSLFAFILFGLSIGVVYGIVALGISLIYSGLDIVHFAHGEIYMFGAFFGLVFSETVGVPYPLAILSAMMVIISWPIRRLFYAFRGQQSRVKARVRRTVILGLDGLEPGVEAVGRAERIRADRQTRRVQRERDTSTEDDEDDRKRRDPQHSRPRPSR